MTISATTRFSKICTAPTREHDFRGSSLPKITHFGTLFPLKFRTFFSTPSGTPFWSLLCRFGPQKVDFGTPSASHWAPKRRPKWSQSVQKPCTKIPRSAPRAPKVIHNAARSPPTLFIYSARDSDRACTFRFRSSLLTPLWGAYRRPTKGPFGGRAPLGGGPP